MKVVDRNKLPSDYAEMMATENHHDHEIVDIDGVLRWKENEGVREIADMCDLNHMIADMLLKGITKNHEAYRRLYRNIGYSLSGYWDVFYWEANNEECDSYVQPVV